MEKLFLSNGFHVNTIGYDKIARKFGKVAAEEDEENILFIAQQLRFSDDQVSGMLKFSSFYGFSAFSLFLEIYNYHLHAL